MASCASQTTTLSELECQLEQAIPQKQPLQIPKATLGDADRQQSPASGISGSNVRCGMRAASQLPGGEPTDVDDAPAPTS